MFKFQFSSENEDCTSSSDSKPVSCSTHSAPLRGIEEIKPDEEDNIIVQTISNRSKIHTFRFNSHELKYFDSKDVLAILKESTNLKKISSLVAENSDSDLIPNQYEGGMKIWECTYDLLTFLSDAKIILKRTRVLDLGCGAGLLGIYSLSQGADVYFQDYNDDVIRYLTIPNVKLNGEFMNVDFKFYSGDWQSLGNELRHVLKPTDKFDYILTSETIYETPSYPDLLDVFVHLLKPTGVIFLAAKMCYFGVGGSIPAFEDFLDERKIFKHRRCWLNETGVRRAILKIEYIS